MSVNEKMTAIADAIREKTGDTANLSLDDMAQTIRKLPDPIVNKAAGNPITLSDATDLKLRGLNLYGKTIQDGTSTPEAPVELVSAGNGGSIGITVAGKNLLNYDEWKKAVNNNNCTVVWENNGVTITATGNDAFTSYSFPGFPESAKVPVIEGDTITLSWEESTNAAGAVFIFPNGKASGLVSVSNTTAKKLTYTVAAGITFITFRFGVATSGTIISYKNIQIELGVTATAYEPYKPVQTLTASTPNGLPGIPVTSGGNYTDETGQQWVCDEVDFGRGVYVQRVKKKRVLSSLKWSYNSSTSRFHAVDLDYKTNEANSVLEALCSHFQANKNNRLDDLEMTYINDTSSGFAYRYDALNGDVNAWKAFLDNNEMYIVAELATPIETALSAEELAAYAILHTNYPNTTILNDGGAGMSVRYVADTKNYIDNKINAMAAAIVNA